MCGCGWFIRLPLCPSVVVCLRAVLAHEQTTRQNVGACGGLLVRRTDVSQWVGGLVGRSVGVLVGTSLASPPPPPPHALSPIRSLPVTSSMSCHMHLLASVRLLLLLLLLVGVAAVVGACFG